MSLSELWRGEFGDRYHDENRVSSLASRTALFARTLGPRRPRSILELGAGRGWNLDALGNLYPSAGTAAVEINESVYPELGEHARIVGDDVTLWDGHEASYDLILTMGLLIHLPELSARGVFQEVDSAGRRWFLMCEYYRPRREMIPWRGQESACWGADFCAEFLAVARCTPRWRLADYGFVYRGDPAFPLDDLTWFLLERGDS